MTAEESGADSVFFIRENSDVTNVYEDWSFSSSSENGLNDVKLVTSSTSLELLRDLDVGLLNDPSTGDDPCVSISCVIAGDKKALEMELTRP